MENKDKVEVNIIAAGPMVVKGEFKVLGADGNELKFDPSQRITGIAFCRCGLSENKPLCDRSHAK